VGSSYTLAPVEAIAGITEEDAKLLKQAFRIKTVAAFAETISGGIYIIIYLL
jgi:hypothetical protein